VSQKFVETAYAGNAKVRFVEVDSSEKANKELVEMYEIASNALIITKGCCNKSHVDITMQAFATAVNSPKSLENLIKTEIDKRLQIKN
jgi:hypothetical protein